MSGLFHLLSLNAHTMATTRVYLRVVLNEHNGVKSLYKSSVKSVV